MNPGLWWWALPVLLLPILWHRRKREQTRAVPLASARFLPAGEPLQLRAWRWNDSLLLLLRCLLLLALLAFLADPVWPWRGSTVLVAPGSAPALVDEAARAAGLGDAPRLDLPGRNAIAWLRAHEREFEDDARLLVVGDVLMPATLPRLRHRLILHGGAAGQAPPERHVAIFSARADAWRRLFGALESTMRIVVDARPDARTDLVIWDLPAAPPAGLRAPLWWVADDAAFPELRKAPAVDGLRYVDSPRGRLWHGAGWPPHDADAARALVADWQRLHYGAQPWTAPAQALAPDAAAPLAPSTGALRERLGMLLLVLFALERMLTHVRRR